MGEIRMSGKERRRLELLARVRDGQLRLVKVAELLPLSYRQCKRIWRRYRRQGDVGLVHRLRGRPSSRRIAAAQRQAILDLYERHYDGFGPTLAAEKLAQHHGQCVDHETLRRWLIAAGQWQRQRKRTGHRQRRERKAYCGELIQIDGSEHDWFEGRGPRAVLMVLIDDATNRTYARFYEAEDTRAAFDVFGRYYDHYGLPQALYADLDSIYRVNGAEFSSGSEPPLTQFGRAMKQLGVSIVPAYSPQAKGRVERRHGVFQDRLVKELRLAGIGRLAAANHYLEQSFLPDLNARFCVAAAQPADLHRKLPRGLRLEEVLCWEEPRVVARDWTLSWEGRCYQIDKRHAALSLVHRRVVVRRLLDGRRQILYRDQKLTWRQGPSRPQPLAAAAPLLAPTKRSSRQRRPAADHPWRRWGIAKGRNFRLRSACRRRCSPPSTPACTNQRPHITPGDISIELR
jgi:transposase